LAERFPDMSRLAHIVVGGAICAICCGVLESSLNISGGQVTTLSTVSAKALSTLFSSLGFAAFFAALAAEFSFKNSESPEVQSEKVTVLAIKDIAGWAGCERELIVAGESGEKFSVYVDLSSTHDKLQRSINRGLLCVPGSIIEITYCGKKFRCFISNSY